MLSGYSCVLIILASSLMFSIAFNLVLGFWFRQFCHQRDILYKNFHLGLYELMPEDLVEVLDQIEGVRKKKEDRD